MLLFSLNVSAGRPLTELNNSDFSVAYQLCLFYPSNYIFWQDFSLVKAFNYCVWQSRLVVLHIQMLTSNTESDFFKVSQKARLFDMQFGYSIFDYII